jgi:hypothetical protein
MSIKYKLVCLSSIIMFPGLISQWYAPIIYNESASLKSFYPISKAYLKELAGLF